MRVRREDSMPHQQLYSLLWDEKEVVLYVYPHFLLANITPFRVYSSVEIHPFIVTALSFGRMCTLTKEYSFRRQEPCWRWLFHFISTSLKKKHGSIQCWVPGVLCVFVPVCLHESWCCDSYHTTGEHSHKHTHVWAWMLSLTFMAVL